MRVSVLRDIACSARLDSTPTQPELSPNSLNPTLIKNKSYIRSKSKVFCVRKWNLFSLACNCIYNNSWKLCLICNDSALIADPNFLFGYKTSKSCAVKHCLFGSAVSALSDSRFEHKNCFDLWLHLSFLRVKCKSQPNSSESHGIAVPIQKTPNGAKGKGFGVVLASNLETKWKERNSELLLGMDLWSIQSIETVLSKMVWIPGQWRAKRVI